jgi:hypothetical protein
MNIDSTMMTNLNRLMIQITRGEKNLLYEFLKHYILLSTDRNFGEKLLPFYEFCSVKKLSDCVDVQEISELFEPCPELQSYIHQTTPLLQRCLYHFQPDIYLELQKQNFSQRLASLQFIKVC